jgi:hypothetical protein
MTAPARGPDTRTTATAALPAPVDNAYTVSEARADACAPTLRAPHLLPAADMGGDVSAGADTRRRGTNAAGNWY